MPRWLIAVALALTSCAPPVASVDASLDGGPPATLLLGAGRETFTPIAEGDTLLLARGCQGAQHVWITLRATNVRAITGCVTL